ncbi:MAG: ABC transporter permease [Caldiserica bacterium]|nr:ABC transporter permease [Caldisericota bacterium]
MRAFDIALKDIRHSFTSLFGLIFMFVVPLLIVGLFAVAFGGTATSDDKTFTVPTTKIVLVNLDEGDQAIDLDPSDADPSTTAGDILTHVLSSDALQKLVAVTTVTSVNAARNAVDTRAAQVAVIIPATFTKACLQGAPQGAVEIYQDPTLTLGPGIVRAIISQSVDEFTSVRIMQSTVTMSLAATGITLSPDQAGQAVQQFVSETLAAQTNVGAIDVEAPPAKQQKPASFLATILAVYMAAMMVFYVYYTGTAGAESILLEQEQGTLQRLFTTRTTPAVVMQGKMLAILLTTALQMLVLMLVAALALGIRWGGILPIAIALVSTALCASAFGIFLMSFLRTTRQAGVVFGGVVTATGMLALASVFTMNVPSAARLGQRVALFVPQGWSLLAFRQAMDGAPLGQLLTSAAVLLAWTAVMFLVGRARMARRFA